MPELSIIVPVYKVEPYLRRCIDSILAQTFRDFELILIDDGSPDNCGAICDEYAAKDSRIKVIHQKNQGVSAARNAGLDIAQGTYLGFVDSDDWIEPEMYETLVSIAVDRGADVVGCVQQVGNFFPESKDDIMEFNTNFDLISDLFSKPSRLTGSCANKLYRRDRISCEFRKGMVAWEDLLFLMDNYMKKTCKGALVLKPFYHYCIHEDSATQRFSKPKYGKDSFRDNIFSVLYDYNEKLASQALSYFLDSSLQLIGQYRHIEKQTEKSCVKEIQDVKMTILYWIIYAWKKDLLTKQQQHRFLVEGVIRA